MSQEHRVDQPQFQAPKKKRKWPIRLAIVAVIVIVLIVAFRACAKRAISSVSGAYLPAQVTRQDLAVTVKGTGTVKPNDAYRATALMRGEILEAPFEEGDRVTKGQLLFYIDDTNGVNTVRNAESGVKRAQLSVEQAQLSYDNLLKNQRDSADNAQIKANAAGVIAKLYVHEGDTVMAGSPIADILDRDTLELTVPFHSVDAAALRVGQTAAVTVGGTAAALTGTVKEIGSVDSVIAGGARVRNVVIRVTNPGALSAGTMAAAQIGDVASAQVGAFAYAASKQLPAPTSGKVETLAVQEGDRVTDKQVIGAFEVVDMASQIDSAALSLRSAQLGLEDAENSLRLAQDALDDYRITSPISGTVIEKNVKAGDNIDAAGGSYLAVIYDLSRLTFDMNISELDVAQLKVGQSVSFTCDALEGKTFSGALSKININGVTANGSTSYPVTVEITAGDGLYPGMNVSASVLIEQVGSVLAVPVEAVQRGDKVYVPGPGALNEAGELADPTKLVQQKVTLGRSDSEYIEILDGLTEGQTIFVPNSASSLMSLLNQMGG